MWEDIGAGHTPCFEPALERTPRRDVTRARPPFALPRADEDNSRRYGYLRDLDRTLTQLATAVGGLQ